MKMNNSIVAEIQGDSCRRQCDRDMPKVFPGTAQEISGTDADFRASCESGSIA